MAVKTGIRFENILALLMPNNWMDFVKKTKEREDARIARDKKEEIMVELSGTVHT